MKTGNESEVRGNKAAAGEAGVKIEPCPFCGGAGEHVFCIDAHWVNCTVCEAVGPTADTGVRAAHLWNTRKAGQTGDTPVKRAAEAAMELFNMIDALSDGDALKAIKVLEARTNLSMITRCGRKAVARGN